MKNDLYPDASKVGGGISKLKFWEKSVPILKKDKTFGFRAGVQFERLEKLILFSNVCVGFCYFWLNWFTTFKKK